MSKRRLLKTHLGLLCLIVTGLLSRPAFAAPDVSEARAIYQQATAAMKSQDYPQAIALFTRSIELNPNDPDAWNDRGATQQMRGDLNAAFDDYSQAIALDPKHPHAWINRANAAWRLDRLDRAWDDLDEAEKIESVDRATIYKNRGFVSLLRGEVAGSFQWLWDAVQANPDDASIQEELTRNLSKIVSQQMLDGANARITANPNDPVAYYDRGYVLMQSGKSQEGVEAFQKALQLDPQFALVYLQVGYYFSMANENDKAIGLFNNAIQLDPGGYAGTLGYWQRARVCHRTNRDQMAASDAASALKRLPKAYQVLCEVARAEHRAGRHESALKYINQALTTRPDDPWALDYRDGIEKTMAAVAGNP